MSAEQMFWKELLLFENFLTKHTAISVFYLIVVIKSYFQMTPFRSELFYHSDFFIWKYLTIESDDLRVRIRLYLNRLGCLIFNQNRRLLDLRLRLRLGLNNYNGFVTHTILMGMTILNRFIIFSLFLNLSPIFEVGT